MSTSRLRFGHGASFSLTANQTEVEVEVEKVGIEVLSRSFIRRSIFSDNILYKVPIKFLTDPILFVRSCYIQEPSRFFQTHFSDRLVANVASSSFKALLKRNIILQ